MVCSLRGSTVGNVLPLTASTNLLLMKHWNKDNRKVWWSCVHCRGPMVHWNCRGKKLEQQKGTVKLCPLWGSVVHWQSKSCCWHSPCTTRTTEMSLQTYCRWSTETRTTERYGEALSIVGAHGTLEQQKNNNWNDNWTTERNTEALSIVGVHGTLVVKALLLTLALY